MKLLSGCELIFNAPKAQWKRILDSLKNSSEAPDASSIEVLVGVTSW